MNLRGTKTKFGVALIALATSVACVDNVTAEAATSHADTRVQAVTAIPEFVITGLERVPESLHLTNLGLTVSEIRLEPMWSAESLAYSTRRASMIDFALDEGQTTAVGEELELPVTGRYLVSIRLEPVEAVPSFHVEGFVADGERADGEDGDGWPQPMPFDEETATADGEWTPFEYQSRRAVFFTFNDVELSYGEQFLTFAFDVREWANGVHEPISHAVERSQRLNDNSVDVTQQLDSTGNGMDVVMRTGVVRSGQHP